MKRDHIQTDVGAKTISVTARATGPNARLSIVFAGDTSFGENYQEHRERRGKENILKSRGYDYTLANFVSTLAEADLAIVNLETPVTSLKAVVQVMNRMITKHNDIPQQIAQLAHDADRYIVKLTGLINDLLNSTRLRGGDLTFNKKSFTVQELLDDCSKHLTLKRHPSFEVFRGFIGNSGS